MKNFFAFFRKLLFPLLLIVLAFTSGYLVSNRGVKIPILASEQVVDRTKPDSFSDVNFAMFWQVWDLLRSDYYDPAKIDQSALVLGAIKGMVSAVGDPYTVFLDRNQQQVTQEDLSGSFDGIGIQIGYKGTQLAVIAPLPDTPAALAGVQPGDLIIGIKDEVKDIDKSTDGMSLPEAVQTIRGPKGSTVTLALLREGESAPIIIDVKRESIDVPSVKLEFVGEDKKVAHIRLTRFGAETKNEWSEAVTEVLGTAGLKGVVIDVRNNPGGYLMAAVDIASEFLNKGTLVVSEEAEGRKIDELLTQRQGKLVGTPVVMLINKGSASASEILAGALRDNLKVKLVGVNSFGKGTVQEPREFPDGTGIHITIARWITPSGDWIHEKGIAPDIEVKIDPEKPEDDLQLKRAIEELQN
jgi:carboxyl-terminal processing protease